VLVALAVEDVQEQALQVEDPVALVVQVVVVDAVPVGQVQALEAEFVVVVVVQVVLEVLRYEV